MVMMNKQKSGASKHLWQNEDGHGPTGLGLFLVLPLLYSLNSLYGIFIFWALLLWVPISIGLLIRKGRK